MEYSTTQFIPSKISSYRINTSYRKTRKSTGARHQTVGATPGFVKGILGIFNERESERQYDLQPISNYRSPFPFKFKKYISGPEIH